MRNAILGFLMLVVTLPSANLHAQDSTDYFPLHVGDFWRYKGDEQLWSARQDVDTTRINGNKYFVLRWYPLYQGVVADAVDDTVRVDTSGDVFFLNGTEEQLLYKFHSVVNDTWEYRYVFASGDTVTHVVTLAAVLDTFQISGGPLKGTYRNVIVFYDDQPGAYDAWTYSYFAPGYGLIFKQWQLDERIMYGALINGRLYGDTNTTDIKLTETPIATNFRLLQNYPNPFNPSSTIEYDLPERTFVDLSVYDLLGRKLKTLVRGLRDAGTYEAKLEGGDLPSGIYLYRLEAEQTVLVRKAMLVK